METHGITHGDWQNRRALKNSFFFFFSGIGLSHGSNIGNLNPSDHCILINLKTIRLSNNSANSISWKTR